LPFHAACSFYNVEVANYLHSLYPESINIRYNDGNSALQKLLWYHGGNEQDCKEMTRFLLLHNQGVLSTPDYAGRLPLHIACAPYCPLSIVKLVYDAYPEALHVRTRGGATPLDIARGKKTEVAQFLAGQLEQARQIIQPGGNGQLPLHRVLRTSEPSSGTIKLMTAANPTSLTTADNQGFISLHFACQLGHLDIVKYIVEAYDELLKVKPREDTCLFTSRV
jgi:ankyrin repeat protein